MAPLYALHIFFIISISCCFQVMSLRCFKSGVIAANNRYNWSRLCGYIAPERDPEYKTMVKKPLPPLPSESFNEPYLPPPREGDIVQCPGLWAETKTIGKIRALQFRNATQTWMADIVPLREGKTDGIYSIDKTAKILSASISDLVPLKSVYLRSENGYKLFVRSNSTSFAIKAPRYRDLQDTFALPKKAVNLKKLESDMEDYEKLKARIIDTTFKFGAAGTLVCGGILGFDKALVYAGGVFFSALYFYLLSKKVDTIASGVAMSSASKSISKIDNILSNSRLLTPVFLVLLVALKNKMFASLPSSFGFTSLSREDFFAAVSGFLTYKLAIFSSEVITEVKTEDWLSFLPGSFAEGYRQSQKLANYTNSMSSDGRSASGEMTTVVFVTGPEASGRAQVIDKLLSRNSIVASSLVRIRYGTSDLALSNRYPERYTFVEPENAARLRGIDEIVYEGDQRVAELGTVKLGGAAAASTMGRYWLTREVLDRPCDQAPNITSSESTKKRFFWQSESVVIAPKKTVFILDGPPSALDALAKMPTLRLLPIWISLQTKEEFVSKATEIVKSQILRNRGALAATADSDELLSKQAAQQISDLVNEAVRDINYYMQKAPIFEYTLLNTGNEDENVEELEQLLKSSLF